MASYCICEAFDALDLLLLGPPLRHVPAWSSWLGLLLDAAALVLPGVLGDVAREGTQVSLLVTFRVGK